MGVDVADTSKLDVFNVGELNTWNYQAATTDADNTFTILDSYGGSVDPNGNVWASTDFTFNAARTVDYIVRIEETV